MIPFNADRISKSVSVDLLSKTTVMIIGNGGSSFGTEGGVRSGIGHLILVDDGTLEAVNLPRQNYSPHQIGMLKVEALKANLLSINPEIDCECYPSKFEELPGELQADLVKQADIILCLAGSHAAALAVNKLALEWQVPAIYGGFYPYSRGAEIVFSIPGFVTTPYCCAVAPRIKQNAQVDSVPNEANPANTAFHIYYLEGMIWMVAMAILHNNVSGYEFSGWFGQRWERNLIQFKVQPNYSSPLFEKTFGPIEDGAMPFQALWRKTTWRRQPLYEDCPICSTLDFPKTNSITQP